MKNPKNTKKNENEEKIRKSSPIYGCVCEFSISFSILYNHQCIFSFFLVFRYFFLSFLFLSFFIFNTPIHLFSYLEHPKQPIFSFIFIFFFLFLLLYFYFIFPTSFSSFSSTHNFKYG